MIRRKSPLETIKQRNSIKHSQTETDQSERFEKLSGLEILDEPDSRAVRLSSSDSPSVPLPNDPSPNPGEAVVDLFLTAIVGENRCTLDNQLHSRHQIGQGDVDRYRDGVLVYARSNLSKFKELYSSSDAPTFLGTCGKKFWLTESEITDKCADETKIHYPDFSSFLDPRCEERLDEFGEPYLVLNAEQSKGKSVSSDLQTILRCYLLDAEQSPDQQALTQ